MINLGDLRRLAKARLRDAEALAQARRFDGAVYMVGYAVEIVLKARICRTLKWQEFPSSSSEFRDFASFKVHKLPILLKLSGREELVRTKYPAEWSATAAWDPEIRYRPTGSASRRDAEGMLTAARTLLRVL